MIGKPTPPTLLAIAVGVSIYGIGHCQSQVKSSSLEESAVHAYWA